MKITITGGTGFTGEHLVKRLLPEGHQLHILGRRPKTGIAPEVTFSLWDASSTEPPNESIAEADAVIHLAGAPLFQRWNPEVKRQLRESRVEGTKRLVEALSKLPRKPSVLISGSAIGFYGSRGDEVLTEESAPGTDFLADVCQDWERAASQAESFGIRVVQVRTGLVLGQGGMLSVMLPPFKMGVGGRLGSGQQWMSWIHIDDWVGLVLFALQESSMRGPVNGTAPNPVRNNEFTKNLARVLRRPALFKVPVFALNALFGEMSDVMFSSQRVLPKAAERAGYKFSIPDLGPALKNLLSK